MTAPQIAVGVREAAALVGLSRETLDRAIKSTDPARHLPAKRIGNRISIAIRDLQDWHDRQPDA